jgi:TonB family protein
VIPAVLARAAAARLGAALARLELRHWVALAGSAALHLGVLLGLSEAPPPLPPPLTFEVKLEPPAAAKPQRHAQAKAKAAKAKKLVARKKSRKPEVREPHTLQAEWKGETRPAKDAPAVSLPEASAIGVSLAKAVDRAAPASLAVASPRPSAVGSAGGAATLSEPGGKPAAGAGAASGGDPGVALAAAQGFGKTQALKASTGAGAQGSDALAGSATASGNLAAASLAASAAAGSSLNRAAGGGGHSVQASDFSSQSPGALASGEPGGVRLTLAGVLSSLPALPTGSGSLAGGQLDGAAGSSAATAGAGSEASLASAASSGQPAMVTAAGATRAGGGSETRAAEERGAAASGGSGAASLASATPAKVLPAGKSGSGGGASAGELATPAVAASGTTAGGGKLAQASVAGAAGMGIKAAGRGNPGSSREAASAAAAGDQGSSDGGTARGLAGAGFASGTGRLAAASGLGSMLPGQASAGAGLSSGKAAQAALAPGEPGSAPRLALAMQAVPAVLEIRPGGARSSFRAAAGEGGSSGFVHPGAAALAQSGGGEAASLPGRGTGSPALSAGSRQTSIASGGGSPAGAGKLQGVKVAAVQQIRPDSQVQPLDVLAPSTYCPLPGHVQPDNRPRDTAQEITEKPAYASDNPSFAFPIRAWAYGHEGRVTVRVQILDDGTPGQMWIKQSSGSGILDVDAREQLAKYRFKPARKNGQPVTAWIDVPVDYRLHAESKP